MNEIDTIRRIAARFRRSGDQVNAPFESDAEFVRLGSQLWGLTIDEFSPAEDLFTAENPRRLGANLAAATLSDLLAAGVEPRFFLHALGLPRAADPEFVDGLSTGLAVALEEAGCALAGGDLGVADPWHFTGFAMGPVASPAPLTRRLTGAPQTLWVSGPLGDLNAAAFSGAPTPAIELRAAAASAARGVSLAGIDTSGGLADALWMLHLASPGVRIEVHPDSVPFAPGVREACAAAGIPPEAALFGGAGEYELLFAVPDPLPEDAAGRLRSAGLTPIGRARASAGGTGVVWVARDGRDLPLREPPPCPRSARDARDHARQAVEAAARLLRGGPAP